MPIDPTASTALPAFSAAPATDRGSHPTQLEQDVVALFDDFRERLLRYLSSLGLPIPDGEEIVQEVFLSLFQHLQRGKSSHNLRGWLFRVAHNLGLRRRYRNRRDGEVCAEMRTENVAVDPAPSPEDLLLRDQAQQRLLAVVRALAEQDRRCLSLRAEGLRYREIAQILDMSLSAVSLSLARTLARIARSAER
ncbi:MAG TPA: sigma-70 family RNA polymerase sigma factor [Bryobacteraceae bacterium]